MEKRTDIQVLRGLAVLLVVLFHLKIPGFENGYLGVDIFFVISGFLMATLYDRGTVQDFYRRRIDRLFPAYIVTVIATLVFGSIRLIPQDFSDLQDQAVSSLFFLSNLYFWNLGDYFELSTTLPLLHLWSLAVEAQFYLLVPFLFPMLRRRKTLFFIFLTTSLLLYFFFLIISPKTAFFFLPARAWEFLIGAGVAWMRIPATRSKSATFVMQTGPLALCLSILIFVNSEGLSQSMSSGLLNVGVTGLIGIAIRYGLPNNALKSRVSRALAVLGNYSYSIYLTHFPVIVLLLYIPFSGSAYSPTLTLAVVAIFITGIASFLMHHLVERNGLVRINTAASRTLALVLVLVGGYGLGAANLQRYTELERKIVTSKQNATDYRCGELTYRIWNIFRHISSVSPLCILSSSETAETKALLVGDSHANAIKDAFAEYASEGRAVPHFVIPNDVLKNKRLDAHGLLAAIKTSGINSVVLHFNSSTYESTSNRDEIFSFARGLIVEGVDVSVIAPVPVYDKSVPAAMWDGSSDHEQFVITYDEYLRQIQAFTSFSNVLAGEGVKSFEVGTHFCPEGGDCLFADWAGTPLYYDSNHLTFAGADKLANVIAQTFEGQDKS